MIFIEASIIDTELTNQKPGVTYREGRIGDSRRRIADTPANIERGFTPHIERISRSTEIFSVKVSGEHLNDTIDKAILVLEGMKNPDVITTTAVSANPNRDPLQDHLRKS